MSTKEEDKTVTVGDAIEAREALSPLEQSQFDEQIAIKVAGSLGLRNHMGDVLYQNRVIDEQLEVGRLRPEDVECMIVIAKIRNTGKTEEEDTYNIHGCLIGKEMELVSLHAIVAARIRRFQELVKKEMQDGKVEGKPN